MTPLVSPDDSEVANNCTSTFPAVDAISLILSYQLLELRCVNFGKRRISKEGEQKTYLEKKFLFSFRRVQQVDGCPATCHWRLGLELDVVKEH